MASQGSKVLASDYNGLQTTVSNILGTGSSTLGYGQSVLSSQVTTSNKISATDWSNLVNDINRIATHQGTSVSITFPISGQIVSYNNNSTNCFLAYSNAVTAISANPQVFPGAGQYSGTVLDNPTLTNMTNGTHYHTSVLSFASANAFRYFFNAGGRIEITPSIAGGGLSSPDGSTTLDQSWQTIFNRIGTTYLYYNSSVVTNTSYLGQSVSVASSIGAYELTTSYQVLSTSATPSGGIYYPNQYQVTAKVDSASSPTAITFQMKFSDTSLGTGSPPWNITYPVDSTITDTISYTRASGSYVSVVPPTLSSSTFT